MEIIVRHNIEQRRFEAEVAGRLAVAEYEIEGDRMIFTHTLVPGELRGRGIAEKLMRAGLAEAKAQGRKVVPACSYVAAFVQRNGEFKEWVALP
jgi:uncharacterized protein